MKKAKHEKMILEKIVKNCISALSQIEGESKRVKEFHDVFKKVKAMDTIEELAKLEGCQNIDLLYDCITDGLNFDDFSIDTDFSEIAAELVQKAKFDKDTSILFFSKTADTSPSNKPKGRNPFSKKHFNLTEQALLTKNNPELAKQLKVEAGEIDEG